MCSSTGLRISCSSVSCVPAVALTLLLSLLATANADLTTYDVMFSANSFVVGSGSDPAPADPVMGAFRITLDPAVAVVNNTADITLMSLNIALGSPLSFSYNPAADGGFTPGTLRVGGLASGSDTIIFNPSTNDFWLYLMDFATTPGFAQLGYSQTSVSNNNLFFTINQTGSVTVSQVPEPASLIFCTLGIAVPAALARRRKRRVCPV